MLYLNTKFPRTKKKYAKEADDNTDLLVDRMSKLLKQEPSTAMAAIAAIKPKTGGSTQPYSYAERKKAKTFKL